MTYILAAFRIDKVKSVAYIKRETLGAFIHNLEEIIKDKDPDYISIRIIKEASNV